MSDDPEAGVVLREWVSKAEGDFAVASKLLEIEGPTWIICFHAQQAAEKYFKAMLVQLQAPFGKTHDIGELLRLLPESKRPPLDAAEAFELTRHAVAGRYPEAPEPTVEEAKRVLALAARIRAFVRGQLPSAALVQP